MNRVRSIVAATVIAIGGVVLLGPAAYAQQAPQLNSVLAGKKLTPPIRGEAQVQFTACAGNAVGCTKRNNDVIVTTVPVKNVSSGPIARLTINITWYDKAGAIVSGGRGVVNGIIQPGEVANVMIETPYNARMQTNNFVFSHVNGTVKPMKVAKLEGPTTAAPTTSTPTTSTPAK
jgi:hypothetical protein